MATPAIPTPHPVGRPPVRAEASTMSARRRRDLHHDALLAQPSARCPGALIRPFEAEFGWDRASISTAVALNLLLFGLMGPIVGRSDGPLRPPPRRYRRGQHAYLGALATTSMTTVWQLDLYWGLIVGMGAGGVAMVLVGIPSLTVPVRRAARLDHRDARRANPTGQIIFVPLVAWLAVNVGWRVGVSDRRDIARLCRSAPAHLRLPQSAQRRGLQRYGEGAVPTGRAAQMPAGPDARPSGRRFGRPSSGGWRPAYSSAATLPTVSSAHTSSPTRPTTASAKSRPRKCTA